jgi:transcriptional regulator with XRE-family HTH domain
MRTGTLIRQAREADGITQAALARRLGITQPAIATLQRALNAMGRALVLRVEKQKSSVDETLLHSSLALTPDERLARFESWYEDVRALRDEVREGDRAAIS